MCFDFDSTPPIPHLHGGSVQHRDLTLVSPDGTEFMAFEATGEGDVAVLVLPDVRGLFYFYEELSLRFAERGFDAVAIDYFGRTAGVAKRTEEWDFMPHVKATAIDTLTDDIRTAVDHLKASNPDRKVFIVGFCFGGSNSWHMAASNLGLAGVIGFYGHPDRPGFPTGAPSIMSRIDDFSCPVLALQGGDDPGIPVEVDDAFRDAMDALGKQGEVIVYDGAPHSFFDRKHEEFQEASEDAWSRILQFIGDNS
jgi:carboxymethylenebutenolidase